jgi:hypothetical protein
MSERPVGARAAAEEILLWHLGRLDRAMAGSAVRQLPEELLDGERLEVVGVGEVPRSRDDALAFHDAEFAVVAATDRRVLVVSRLRVAALPYAAITSVAVEARGGGSRLIVATGDGTTWEFASIAPTPARANELAEAIEAHRPGR